MIQPLITNSTYVGGINMIDNALTARVTRNSTLLGQAPGFTQERPKRRKYNGSTITIFGRNTAMSEVREMPIVGGSGIFRFARGYVEARTKWVDLKTLDATVFFLISM
ncbi:unnamed protein product [Brassica oleracea var. botrytis]